MTTQTHPSPAPVYGVRCGIPEQHKTDQRIYAISPHRHEMALLAKNTCYEVLVSHDGGATWAPDTQQEEVMGA